MPFWKKKEPEVPLPHVEPGMSAPQSSEPNPKGSPTNRNSARCILCKLLFLRLVSASHLTVNSQRIRRRSRLR